MVDELHDDYEYYEGDYDEGYDEGYNEGHGEGFEDNGDTYTIAPEDELLMHTYNTLPSKVKKFWSKRYDLFSKYDEGVYMNTELWYSVTPEAAAKFIAIYLKKMLPQATTILDLCCGGGGNTIQFAEIFDSVGAIDINPVHVHCTNHNAGIYNVHEKIWLYVGDWNEMVGHQNWIPEELKNENQTRIFDFIFCSPPWGGPSYTREANSFDLLSMEPFSVPTLLKQMSQYTRNMGLFLPRNLNMDQLREVTRDLFGPSAKCRVVLILFDGHLLGVVVFFGPEVTDNNKI